MIYAGQSREQLRQVWLAAWRKHCDRALLSPLESQLVGVISAHPEYHAWLQNGDSAVASETASDNPFLHLSLHLALREQLGTDRPPGIRAVIDKLARRLGDAHLAEHRATEVLGRMLWEAQRGGHAPDEQLYLAALRGL
jgi:hypothetical protein